MGSFGASFSRSSRGVDGASGTGFGGKPAESMFFRGNSCGWAHTGSSGVESDGANIPMKRDWAQKNTIIFVVTNHHRFQQPSLTCLTLHTLMHGCDDSLSYIIFFVYVYVLKLVVGYTHLKLWASRNENRNRVDVLTRPRIEVNAIHLSLIPRIFRMCDSKPTNRTRCLLKNDVRLITQSAFWGHGICAVCGQSVVDQSLKTHFVLSFNQ